MKIKYIYIFLNYTNCKDYRGKKEYLQYAQIN